MTAYDKGQKVRLSDLPIQANPYKIDSNDYINWEKGWAKADNQINSISKRITEREKKTYWITSSPTSNKSELYDRYK